MFSSHSLWFFTANIEFLLNNQYYQEVKNHEFNILISFQKHHNRRRRTDDDELLVSCIYCI